MHRVQADSTYQRSESWARMAQFYVEVEQKFSCNHKFWLAASPMLLKEKAKRCGIRCVEVRQQDALICLFGAMQSS